MGRPHLLFLLVFPAFLLLSACGIETYVFLIPPVSTGSLGTTFRFEATGDNDEAEFLGFELYYRFYETSPPSNDINITEQTVLVSRGFRRVYAATDRLNQVSRPLIPAPPSTPIAYSVDFSNTDYRRGLVYKDNQDPSLNDYYKKFLHDPPEHYFYSIDALDKVVPDADVGPWIRDKVENSLNVSMVVYALSYGIKDLSQPIYSEAIYLGTIDIKFWL